ncbi:hypothetical protein VIGAN_09115900 [Vigna angularis var. angularis]|uniref:Uncharacterized protein n=1 Tax=Vigna angularis var. angularis TaxID=157739 RepID=A0A0S3SXP7_PHAAN|nr:hypothetical protein VIGAN_09115900 [Vigna angularis var. angularis]
MYIISTLQCEKLLGEAVVLPGLRSELEALRRRQGRIINSNALLFTSVSLLCKIYYYLCCKCVILFVCTKS